MGRKPKNTFIEATLVFKEGSKIKRYDVKMPFLYSMRLETNDPNYIKAQTIREYFLKDHSKLDELIKEIESQPFKVKVIKVDQAVRQLIDLCPRCHKRGVPKIEKKDSHDRRTRRPTHLGEIERNKVYSQRLEEYWLTYTHSRTQKCRISQYINTPYPAYKHNEIEIEKYLYPQVIGNMKRGTVWYSD